MTLVSIVAPNLIEQGKVMEMLQGGRDNAIYRTGDRVSRPASSWTIVVKSPSFQWIHAMPQSDWD